jgi:hypothetical protein
VRGGHCASWQRQVAELETCAEWRGVARVSFAAAVEGAAVQGSSHSDAPAADGGRAEGEETAVRTGTSGVADEEECVQWSSDA